MMNDLIESFSGIRGIYGQGITTELVERYVFCYCQLFKNKLKSVVVAGDTRPSTSILKKAAIKAFSDCGIKKIIDIGEAPIQVAQHAILKFKASGGIYITASHNEPEFNGWKILKADGALIYASQSEQLIKMAREGCKEPGSLHRDVKNVRNLAPYKPAVLFRQEEAINNYVKYILSRLGKNTVEEIKKARLQILIDPNGGTSAKALKKIFSLLGVRAKFVNDQPGKFGRKVEPNRESLAYLDKYLENGQFEFAAGFDCDADRVELVVAPQTAYARELGPVVSGNYVLSLACDAMLLGTKGQVVVTNDVTAYLVRDVIKKYQAKMKEVEVGEMVVVEEMEKQKSIIGGEGSNGGVIIPPIKCRDGIMTLCLILKLMALRDKKFIDILEEYPRYYWSHNKLACQPEQSFQIKKELESHYRSIGYKIKKTGGATGGLKALADASNYIWFRQSKTEPG
ncbi:MAG: hypothetical protein NTZ42_00700, partial [Candidatus Gribaldobacteria bacterium]|nr:hypothetical protein [Candidatus Gribaldobacteria bacterium]